MWLMARKTRASVPPPRDGRDEKLTLAEVFAELKIGRSTWDEWCAKGLAPDRSKLPNGQIRVARSDLDNWYKARRVA